MELSGGSQILSPLGQVLARAAATDDERVTARLDLDQLGPVRTRWNFPGRGQPQQYGPLLTPVIDGGAAR